MDVWDTHTHLVGDALPAQSFWDIAHYFWFLRELRAVGYPQDAEALDEGTRIEAFLQALRATTNTSMNWVVRQIFSDLYGCELTDAASVRAADTAVRETAAQREWPRQVCDRIGVRRMVVNAEEDADFADLPGMSFHLPRLEKPISDWIGYLGSQPDQRAGGSEVQRQIAAYLAGLAETGCRGVMTSGGPFGRICKPSSEAPQELAPTGNAPDDLSLYVLHALCRAAQDRGMFVQFFLGVENAWGSGATPANFADRILVLHGLFSEYACEFELVLAAESNNLDAVQAARIFPNVHVGGMWWYNFRASTYRQAMQYRFEALPPSKSAFVASDARCIEWCYGKVLLIKRLMADFLFEQVELGWIDEDEAMRVAGEWLHGAAVSLYAPRSSL